MKTYRFAKFYLNFLIVVSFVVLSIGIVWSFMLCYDACEYYSQAKDEENNGICIDTQTIGKQLAVMASKVSSVTKDGEILREYERLNASDFTVSNAATLSVGQKMCFVSYLGEAEKFVDKCKSAYISNSIGAFDALQNMATIALPKSPPSEGAHESNNGRVRIVKPFFSDDSLPGSGNLYKMSSTESEAESHKEIGYERIRDASVDGDGSVVSAVSQSRRRRLVASSYQRESSALARNRTDKLKSVVDFMTNKVSSYTPSARAQELSKECASRLHDIIQLIERERTSARYLEVAAELSNEPAIAEQYGLERRNLEKEELIHEFIRYLNECRAVVIEAAVSDWAVDAQLEELKIRLDEHDKRVAEFVGKNISCAKSSMLEAMLVLIRAIVASILLLIVRDFLSATIDIALNTADMKDALKKLST